MRTLLLLGTLLSAALAADFESRWPAAVTRPWPGPEYWSNPLQDWQIRNGRLECIAAGGDRNVFLLTREVSGSPSGFDQRESAVRGVGLNAGVSSDGRLFIGQLRETPG